MFLFLSCFYFICYIYLFLCIHSPQNKIDVQHTPVLLYIICIKAHVLCDRYVNATGQRIVRALVLSSITFDIIFVCKCMTYYHSWFNIIFGSSHLSSVWEDKHGQSFNVRVWCICIIAWRWKMIVHWMNYHNYQHILHIISGVY